MPSFINRTGLRYTRLLVLERVHGFKQTHWYCKCDCGSHVVVSGNALRQGLTKSCGCLKREGKGVAPKHGHARKKNNSPEYVSWRSMRDRCLNPKSKLYSVYGGRGITICDSWLSDFVSFLEDMGPRPAPGYTVDRIDNDLGYTKDNCRWADKLQQSVNRRFVVKVSLGGQYVTLREASVILGLSLGALKSRVYRSGLTPQQVVDASITTTAAHDLLDAQEAADETEQEETRRIEAELAADADALLAEIAAQIARAA